MKKNVIFRIAAIVLMCTLVTACFASSTFAKYTSSAKGNATATVAKWDIKVNGEQLGVAQKSLTTFNFAGTWYNMVNASDPTVVTDKIAPGTQGSFDVKVKNESDTAAAYTIKIAYADGSVQLPASFALYKDSARTQKINLNGTNFVDVKSGELAIGSTTAQEDTVTVYWQWDYNGANTVDTDDTAAGIAAGNVNFQVEIVVDQID